jgi:bla regulator protein blaR1
MKSTLVALATASVLLIAGLSAQDTLEPWLVKISEGTSKNFRIHYVAPIYPADAMLKCVEGEVVMGLIVSKTGAVSHVAVLSGPTVLADSAMAAAKKWMYEPYILDGKPIRYRTRATEKFRTPHGQCPHGSSN